MTPPNKTFSVALTADFYDANGKPKYNDIGLSVLDAQPHITHRVFKEHRKQIGPDQLAGANGVIVLTPAVTAETVSQSNDLLVIARFGVGYDAVDVKACTALPSPYQAGIMHRFWVQANTHGIARMVARDRSARR